MRLKFELDDNTPEAEYFHACARIRDIAPSVLLHRVIKAACQDRMIAAILDDDSQPVKAKSEHRYHRSGMGHRPTYGLK